MYSNSGVNKVFLVGYVGEEPRHEKLQQDKNGAIYFPLITTETLKGGNNPVLHHEMHQVKAPLSFVEQELKKGQTLHVEGKVQTTAIIDDQHIKRYKTLVIASKITVLLPSESEAR